ncbi:hypothetical protein [Paenibacillus alvei]|uniref:Uncharacterized protein n=1 Tax=Paenibacillus alvei TaxID=44250 RepID=A0AAP7DJV9_PAEAL|nr:hypothetical protein [Paenibacillus alvei]MBG9736215.1 hypothetical protein [Paenibacillus alvei]MBG9745914.1 hypothetical protein [Paenibacillus alvei]MCY9582683.1 hypothetical protein [Paenibacillus alvei]MCY9587971.1 hypothetical protein [Paenibacillus alvei]NOJ72325.1 hypothetical protein [Paenibacillus alvei]
MSQSFTYLLFSTLDAAVVNALILKIYKQPLLRYKYKLLILSVALALCSFLLRTQINLPTWDLPLQYIILVFFYYSVLEYRLHYAAFIIGSGLSAYISIQMIVYYSLAALGVADQSVIFANTGYPVNSIQLCSFIICAAIAVLLRATGMGFSFIIVPPHDTFRIKYSEYSNRIVIISGVVSAITIFLTLVIIMSQNYILLMMLSLASFGIAYFLSDQGDDESVRESFEEYCKNLEEKQS